MTEPTATRPKRKKTKRRKASSSSLPKGVQVQRRPIMHPPIPSPYAGVDQPKIVYVSARTPFISAVKRVQKLLALIEKRDMGKVSLVAGESSDKGKLEALGVGTTCSGKQEEVLIKATGKAIKNATQLAKFFQAKEDINVQLRTGSVAVVDDLVKLESLDDGATNEAQQDDEDIPETRVRNLSMLEVAITQKRG